MLDHIIEIVNENRCFVSKTTGLRGQSSTYSPFYIWQSRAASATDSPGRAQKPLFQPPAALPGCPAFFAPALQILPAFLPLNPIDSPARKEALPNRGIGQAADFALRYFRPA